MKSDKNEKPSTVAVSEVFVWEHRDKNGRLIASNRKINKHGKLRKFVDGLIAKIRNPR